ncbi:MAG: cyclic nucleotide-binding domain-containing protein [Bdellovibrionales bacterium]|nr:cyclic nucleotide-binding domain-containing protein [Bdellovibrionales bacterium]
MERFAQEGVRAFGPGDVVFREGDNTHEMYVVCEGEVEVTKKTEKGDMTLAVLRKGDFLGEMSLLESLPRSATARAKGSARLLCIQPGGFLLKIRRDPTFAFELLQALSRRIRSVNERLAHQLSDDRVVLEKVRKILGEQMP